MARGTRRPHTRRTKSRPRVAKGAKNGTGKGCALVLLALASVPAVLAWLGAR